MRYMTPFGLMQANAELWSTMVEAQTVMTLRLLGMSGAISAPRGETARMVAEKPEAIGRALMAASLAAASGQTPDRILRDANRPISRKTRANAKRLTKTALKG